MEEALWDQKDASFVQPLFANYQAWFRRRLLPDLKKRAKIHLSHFPGDFCLEVDIADAFPLCLVGLNSTWQQYKGGDFERKLTIPLPVAERAERRDGPAPDRNRVGGSGYTGRRRIPLGKGQAGSG